jgi:glutamate carboxypeptidase
VSAAGREKRLLAAAECLLRRKQMNGRELLRFCEQHRQQMIATLRQLVELESPSTNKQAADRCGEFIAERLEQLGGRLKIHRHRDVGDQIRAEFTGTGKPILLLGHYDTVWDVGTLATMPWRARKGRLYGPGVFDMKAGIALLLTVLAARRQWKTARALTVLLNGDEEIGSEASRPQTEQAAKKSSAVLVLEPAHGGGGAVKTARKGVGDFTLKVTGVAAHAGLDFEKGQSAVLELARQIERVSRFTDLRRGLTVNAGVTRGGTRANVVAAEAEALVDVRFAHARDGVAIEKKFNALRAVNRKCRLAVTGGINRPPLERTAGVARLYEHAREAARELGWKLGEAAVGGGSDGNFTGALGIPTLDGLGAVGEGAHAANESVIADDLPRRAALLASLIQRL